MIQPEAAERKGVSCLLGETATKNGVITVTRGRMRAAGAFPGTGRTRNHSNAHPL